MIAKGSLKFILPFPIIGFSLFFLIPIVGWIIIAIGAYMLWFFRDPYRIVGTDDNLILAVADGKITLVEKNENSIKIAIRMSPFDVHINRSPFSGIITEIKYHPGTHKSVYFAGADKKNESNLIKIENDHFVASVLQITGAFARRIECWVKSGEKVQMGKRIGMIRFGSQTNILIENKQVNKIKIEPIVKEGESVRAGVSSLAKIIHRR